MGGELERVTVGWDPAGTYTKDPRTFTGRLLKMRRDTARLQASICQLIGMAEGEA